MPNFDCSLAGIRIESLRGFSNAMLRLDQEHIFLVGPNNSGKSSLLRMLAWAVNDVDLDLLTGRRHLSKAEQELLLPAADTQGRARRITLIVSIPDGRRRRRFGAASTGEARIRLKVKREGVSAHMGAPTRSEPDSSDPLALELMQALQQRNHFAYVPNARDVSSTRFRDALAEQSRVLLRDALTPSGAGRHPRSVKAAQESVKTLRSQAVAAVSMLERELTAHAKGLFENASIDVPLAAETLIDLLASQAELRISTGAHDSHLVPAHEVGSGLQSLLFVGLMRTASTTPGRRVTLLLEEPETFLHPAAQRELAQALLDSPELRFIASTHSAAMLDEARASDVVLLRDHRVYSPSALDPKRGDIDSAFMSGQGAEAVFARSVLLVEGPGDLAAFEQFRRRIARLDGMSRPASSLAVVQVGGCERFAPWIRLLRGFVDAKKTEGIAWFALADGDACTRLRKGLREAAISVPEPLRAATEAAQTTHGQTDVAAHLSAVEAMNSTAESLGIRAAVLPFDLEYALLASATLAQVREYSDHLNVPATDGLDLAHNLGSTFNPVRKKKPLKTDWMRAHIAQQAPWDELHPEVRRVLRLWLAPALGGRAIPSELN